MNIRFLQDVELQVVEQFDEEADTINEESTDCYSKGDFIPDVSIIGENKEINSVDIQFPDGSCCFGVNKDWFDVLE